MLDFFGKGAVRQVATYVASEITKARIMKRALEEIAELPCAPGSQNCGAAKRAKDALAEAERASK